MRTLIYHLFMVVFILFMGCKDNPVEVHEDETLTAELTISTGHIHTLSEITYTVVVKDVHGTTVTDMESVEVQRKAHGSDTWRGTALDLAGTEFSGTYTFSSSGEYDIRVVGIRKGSTEEQVMYTMDEHLEVARAHMNVGNYRIEFESFPGHIHEGDVATVKFWVKQAEKNEAGERPPISGLAIHIHCENPDGSFEHHGSDVITEEEAGVYVDDHTFLGAGESHVGMHFTAADNTEIEAEFHFHVVHGH